MVLQVLQHRRIRRTPGTFAIAPFGRLLRPAVEYGDGYSIPPIPGAGFPLDEIGFTLDEVGFTLDEVGFTLDEVGFTLDEVGFTLDKVGFTLYEVRFHTR